MYIDSRFGQFEMAPFGRGAYHIAAPDRKSLERLLNAAGLQAECEITECTIDNRDCCVLVDMEHLLEIFVQLAVSLELEGHAPGPAGLSPLAPRNLQDRFRGGLGLAGGN